MFVSTHGITARPTSGPSYGTLTTAWIAATGETDLTILGALNTLESDMATYGLTAKMKALYPMVGGTAAKHKFNFMDARDLDAAYRLVFNGGWTHSSTGALPNGTNAYADSKLNTLTVLSISSAHISHYARTTPNIGVLMANDSLDSFLQLAGGQLYGSLATGSYSNTTQAANAAFYMVNRPNGTNQKLIRNSTILLNDSKTSTSFSNKNIFLGAYNGSAVYPSNAEIAISSIGDGLNDTEAANFYTAVQRFQTTLGRQVGAPLYDNGTLLLDTYTASSAAYSASRKLRNNYDGYAFRVRRSSDNAEQDIPFTSLGVVDQANLTTFVGANDGFITTLYDQSGNSKDATQSTAANQHRIVSSGTIETISGKPAFNTLTRPPITLTSTTYKNAVIVGKVDTQNFINYVIGISSPSTTGLFFNGTLGGVDGLGGFDGSNVRTITGEDTNRHLGWFQMKSSKLFVAKDGAAETDTGSFAASLNLTEIGGRSGSSIIYFQGKIQEVIIYNTDETANKSGIETNINTFYSIY